MAFDNEKVLEEIQKLIQQTEMDISILRRHQQQQHQLQHVEELEKDLEVIFNTMINSIEDLENL